MASWQVSLFCGDRGGFIVVYDTTFLKWLRCTSRTLCLVTGLSPQLALKVNKVTMDMGHRCAANQSELVAAFVLVLITVGVDDVR